MTRKGRRKKLNCKVCGSTLSIYNVDLDGLCSLCRSRMRNIITGEKSNRDRDARDEKIFQILNNTKKWRY